VTRCVVAAVVRAVGGAVVVSVVVVIAIVGAGSGCDARAAFAQSSWFADDRPELLAECCACLATRGTADTEATCTEAVLVDGVAVVPDGAVFGRGGAGNDAAEAVADIAAREQDDVVDPGEVPCICGGLDEEACVATLGDPSGRVVVPGACLARVGRVAACEDACGGVLSFVPIVAPAG
jgi:hypothetical protein